MDINPGTPLNPDDIQHAATVVIDTKDDDILSANLEMAAELNERIALEDGAEAKIFQGALVNVYIDPKVFLKIFI